MKILDEIFADVPDDEREQMCFTNTIELYDIDVAALP